MRSASWGAPRRPCEDGINGAISSHCASVSNSVRDTHRAFQRPAQTFGRHALAAGATLAFFAVIRRRLEYAAALHSGASKPNIAAIAFVEVAAWQGIGTLIAFGAIALAVTIEIPAGSMPLDVLGITTEGPALAFVSGIFGTAIGMLVVRERHLFRYFKER